MDIVKDNKRFELTSFHLRVIAMVSMVIDHFITFFPSALPNTLFVALLGRLAFPIFAFQVAEGYVHTKDFKKYCKKLFIFAIIAEIPYNLVSGMYGFINPFAQNILWTFLLGLIVIRFIDKFKSSTKNKTALIVKIVLVCVLGHCVGDIAAVDYRGAGVLTVVFFYLTRNIKYKHLIQLVGLAILSTALKGVHFSLNIFGFDMSVQLQLFAMLALIPIWLYRGKQGYTSKAWANFCYWFYPAHIVILFLASFLFSYISSFFGV